MNEKIKELAKQSLPEFYLTNCPSALEKFAELIIYKCAQVGEDTGGDWHVSSEILKEFGLK